MIGGGDACPSQKRAGRGEEIIIFLPDRLHLI
jgi:hypothetical protein